MIETTHLLKGNIFDIRSIGHLKRVAYFTELIPGKKYVAAPCSSDGVPKYAWITEFVFVELLDKHSIVGECTIMDGNYSFTRIFTDKDAIIYFIT